MTAHLQNSSNESFEHLARSHLGIVRKVVRSFGLTGESADDMVQDVLTLAWRHHGSLRDTKAFPKWIATIARNACIASLRRKRIVTVALVPWQEQSIEAPESPRPNDATTDWELSLEALETILAHYPHALRKQIAHLYYFEERPLTEISELLGLNCSTVRSHLRRFRLAVAASLAQLQAEGSL